MRSVPLATPVPVNERLSELSEASLPMETVALNAPAALGLNSRLAVAAWPAEIDSGRVVPLSEKYLLEIDRLLTVTDAPPVFDRVTESVLFFPAVTLPKFSVDPLKESMPGEV